MIVGRVKITAMEKALLHLGGEILITIKGERIAIVDGRVMWSATAGYNGESTLYEVVRSDELNGEVGLKEKEFALDR